MFNKIKFHTSQFNLLCENQTFLKSLNHEETEFLLLHFSHISTLMKYTEYQPSKCMELCYRSRPISNDEAPKKILFYNIYIQICELLYFHFLFPLILLLLHSAPIPSPHISSTFIHFILPQPSHHETIPSAFYSWICRWRNPVFSLSLSEPPQFPPKRPPPLLLMSLPTETPAATHSLCGSAVRWTKSFIPDK